ncbi:hypothetical protein KFE25_012690 [Diacronema lutheri]|uniref:tRNA carboxymethyluridine synthase n=3 Tax=Diacronema lutheri TaxID=2081491 RepID=A0A8J5X649_DIALT|nr:hypothetical protein KFE25_012690 [Diacronema lutheri]
MASSARPPSAFSPAQPLHRNMEPSTLVPEEATLNYVNDDIEDIYHRMDNLVPAEKIQAYEAWLRDLLLIAPTTDAELTSAMVTLRRRYRSIPSPKKYELLHTYHALLRRGDVQPAPLVVRTLTAKGVRSQSGVLVITVLTSPTPTVDGKVQPFSCQWDCYYCPNQPGQPRSYLRDEPAVLRANENGFDPVLQFTDRAATLAANGHPVDKVELLVLGGTWESYPRKYQESFIRDLFYAANTFWERPGDKRPRRALSDEIEDNEAAQVKVIGLTLETRPDTISNAEIRRLRAYGCTRVQLGVQHTDDGVLALINRGATDEDTRRALRLLKDAGYKVDVHLMPNLPGASPSLDAAMFETMSSGADHQADQWKIYPCEVTPWTVIQKWHESGRFVPYPDEELIETILDAKARVQPWVRLNRIVRDIPSYYIKGGINSPSLRQTLPELLRARGQRCRCIRCREVAGRTGLPPGELVERRYIASGGDETFISVETVERNVIFGFARLRVGAHSQRRLARALWPRAPLHRRSEPEWGVRAEAWPTPAAAMAAGAARGRRRARTPVADEGGDGGEEGDETAAAFPELVGAALVRELHVYGQLVQTARRGQTADSQHTGYGRAMMARAEWLAAKAGCEAVAVISGVGARGYYRKLGYELHTGRGGFMVKRLALVLRARGLASMLADAARERAPAAALVLAAAAAAGCALALRARGCGGGGGGSSGWMLWARVR